MHTTESQDRRVCACSPSQAFSDMVIGDKDMWIETPLVYSSHISDIIGCSAYLKLEVWHRSKSRAIR